MTLIRPRRSMDRSLVRLRRVGDSGGVAGEGWMQERIVGLDGGDVGEGGAVMVGSCFQR